MTDFKSFARCVKDCAEMCEVSPDHTNKDCHLKKCCHCYEVCKFPDDKKEDKNKNESKICKICCCLVEKCKCKSKSPRRERCICCKKGKSPEREICKLCCRLMKNCLCKEKASKRMAENRRPRTLCEDLPLYDEKSHLLGYIKKGAIIDEPFCDKSRDKVLESKSNSDPEEWPRMKRVGVERACMASCRYAEGVRRDSGDTQSVPRWTTKSAFDYATTPASRSPKKSRKKSCPCEK